ncbi:MAG: NAD(P)/FAD-dependent oxidoreductase [Treponemataceae bacterium]|nr:NAD(P)/FAD-dependent oxidoreductase [Treponemataceae bacterium]
MVKTLFPTLNPPVQGMPSYDVAIIGCGVVGANIARRLSAYRLQVVVVEKAADVSFGTSKANSGIIHGGFHHPKKYLKSRLELQGNWMFDRLHQELGFPFKRCGIVVAALHEDEMKAVEHLYWQGRENGALGLELCSRERLLSLEPQLSPEVVGGLYAPAGGIIEPYRFVFALVESALKNGVHLYTNWKVVAAHWDTDEKKWHFINQDGKSLSARFVVNAAGLYADEVSRLFGAEEYTITPRKGEYFLLDRLTPVRPERVVFPVPSALSKGMLVIPTVEGTVLVGPTAEPVLSKEDLATTAEHLDTILEAGKRLVPGLNRNDVITSFAGLRPVLGEDFYIEVSKKVPAFIQVAGIQSPGLTASPAIGEYVKDLLKAAGLELTEKPDWNPYLAPFPQARNLSPYEWDTLVQKDPAWGHVVCRCEAVTEAEIVEAIRQGHTTLDGIKYFTRAQMGRCQGAFCTYKIIKILMRETGMSYAEITKHGETSYILRGAL